MDRIGDFLSRIRNAGMAGQKTTIVPKTRFIVSIAELLKKEGYIGDFEEKEIKGVPYLVIEILYTEDDKARVHGSKRVSKLSGRVYKGAEDITPVHQGFGKLVLSTPEGVITGEEAEKEKVGGEVLFEIW